MNKTLEEEINKLKRWDAAYYAGNPIISDSMYDYERSRIILRIQKEDPNNAYLSSVGAPLPEGSNWAKFHHPSVMGSLFKADTKEEFLKWTKKKGEKFFLAEKADGWTLVAYYENGKLKTLATRGDGQVGDDVTPNAKYFQNVKQNLPDNFTGTIRGEGIVYLDAFTKHFAPLNFSNPRNSAGKIRDRDNPELKSHIIVKWFDIVTEQVEFSTWGDKFFYLKKLGLETITHYDDLYPSKVWEIYQTYVDKIRRSLNYWIDGLVVRVANLEEHDALGITDNRPKGSVALKFPHNGVRTHLRNIEYSLGRSGRVTPVGLIDPVIIDGTTVGRVNLHGQDWITELDLQLNDTVEVAKAGDIIPQIIAKINSNKDSRPIVFPTQCPACKEKLIKNGAYLECQNSGCSGELAGSIAKWIEKTGIKGIGDAVLAELAKTFKDVSELYTSDFQVFAKAAKGSEKIGKKIHKEIQKTRNLPLAIFLSALHIDSLGDTNGQRLASQFKTLDGVLLASLEEIKSIKGIDANAEKIFTGLKNKATLISKLQNLLEIEEISVGPLSGLSFCITGTLSKGRDEIESWIKQQGGTAAGGVSKDLSYLITNNPDGSSSKNKKADQYGIAKITEEQLYQLAGPVKNKPQKRLTVKKKQVSSLFDPSTETTGWILLEEIKNNQYRIINSDIAENPGDIVYLSSKDETAFSELKFNSTIEFKRDKIYAPSFEAIEEILKEIIFDKIS